MEVLSKLDKGLKNRWEELNTKKTTILSLCEKYAAWTLPYVFPPDNITQDQEMPVEIDAIGAQGVNHLSNKIVSTLYPAKSLFFRLVIDQEMRDLIEAALAQTGKAASQEDIKQALEIQVQEAEALLTKAEKRAEEHLDMVKYRPQAINAVKQLIITGNALIFHPEEGGPVQVYSLRNYHVVRDCNNEPVEIMTREKKAFETFHPAVQEVLKADAKFKAHFNSSSTADKKYQDSTEVTIYTQAKLMEDGKWHVTQYADDVRLNTSIVYARDSLRWIPLTWNLVQGEDYGRGLVADFAGAFHSIMVLNNSLLNMAAIMGDIKFFVDPQSHIDVVELQNSLPGSYHSGKPDQIGTAQMNFTSNYQAIQASIERFQKQIAQAFMLTQQLRRDAERVTAEEIRQDVDELETSNSGVYSRLAADWQVRTAFLALQDTGFDGVGDGIQPRVITGMDSLSRAGEAYNMRLFLTDLGLLQAVPEDIRAAVKKPQFVKQIAQYHQVPYEAWMMTETEMRAVQQQETQNQAALQQQAADGQMQVEGVKAAASEA